MEFSFSGAPLKQSDLSLLGDALDLPREYQRFLLWKNGGSPEKHYFDWIHPTEGKTTTEIDHFLSLDLRSWRENRDLDVVWWLVRFRHYLPRCSIPIAIVDLDCFLVTYPSYHERADQVWHKYHYHENPDSCEPEEKLHFVADSVPELIIRLYVCPEE